MSRRQKCRKGRVKGKESRMLDNARKRWFVSTKHIGKKKGHEKQSTRERETHRERRTRERHTHRERHTQKRATGGSELLIALCEGHVQKETLKGVAKRQEEATKTKSAMQCTKGHCHASCHHCHHLQQHPPLSQLGRSRAKQHASVSVGEMGPLVHEETNLNDRHASKSRQLSLQTS